MEVIDFGKLLRQTLADMDGEIQKSPYKFKIDIPKEAVMVYADGDRMYRVFQNLIEFIADGGVQAIFLQERH